MTTLRPAADAGDGWLAAIAAIRANAMLMMVRRADRWRDALWAPLGVTGNSRASSLPERPKGDGPTEGWCRPRQHEKATARPGRGHARTTRVRRKKRIVGAI